MYTERVKQHYSQKDIHGVRGQRAQSYDEIRKRILVDVPGVNYSKYDLMADVLPSFVVKHMNTNVWDTSWPHLPCSVLKEGTYYKIPAASSYLLNITQESYYCKCSDEGLPRTKTFSFGGGA